MNIDFLKPREESGWYDLHLHNHRDMQPHQRRAHLLSMKGSQGREYGRKLRLVLTEQDDLAPGSSPWEIRNYHVPDLDLALTLVDEVVIRVHGRDIVVDHRGLGQRERAYPTGRIPEPPNMQHVAPKTPEVAQIKAASRRRLDL